MKKTNIGFCFLCFAYIEWRRLGRIDFDLVELWQWTCLLMEELPIGAMEIGTTKTRERIFQKMLHKYDTEGWDKNQILKKNQIKHHYQDDEEEVAKMWVQFLTDDGYFCGGAIEEFFISEYPTIAPVVLIGASDPAKRMYQDPKVEYFYQTIKKNGLDYYSAFEAMGVLELDIDGLFGEEGYQLAYQRAKKVIDQKIEAQKVKKALEGELPAINAHFKQRGREEEYERTIEKDEDARFDILKQPPQDKRKSPARPKTFSLPTPEINPAEPT